MGLLSVSPGPSAADMVGLIAGYRMVKDGAVSYSLSGMLHLSSSGWLMLTVPNAIVRGVFAAMDEHGIELPPPEEEGGRFSAGVTVMSPEDIEKAGGPDKITERGKSFSYSLGRLQEVEPADWPGVERVWFLTVHSQELQTLRQSYGLTALPHDGGSQFHVPVAVRRRGVLARGGTAKGS